LKKESKVIRYIVIAVLTVVMIYFGFKRERNLLVFNTHSVFKFVHIYLILTSAIIHLLFKQKKYTKITAGLFAFYMIICFALIQLGTFGVDYHLSVGLSHYLEDLFLSPFPLMLLIPAFMISKRMQELEKN